MHMHQPLNPLFHPLVVSTLSHFPEYILTDFVRELCSFSMCLNVLVNQSIKHFFLQCLRIVCVFLIMLSALIVSFHFVAQGIHTCCILPELVVNTNMMNPSTQLIKPPQEYQPWKSLITLTNNSTCVIQEDDDLLVSLSVLSQSAPTEQF